MADDSVRLEIAFSGPQMLSVLVPVATADELEAALRGTDARGAWSFEGADGPRDPRGLRLLRR
jgi:hypothetical protein